MESLYKKIRILQVVAETADSRSLLIEYADGSPITYQSGQFITLVFVKTGGQEDRRSYSFSSTPGVDPIARITVKRIANGAYSRPIVDHVKAGDEFLTTGVSGFFSIPDSATPAQQLVFLAAGSGITPVYSLIKHAIHRGFQDIVLIYSNHSPDVTVFYQELKALQQSHSGSLRIEFLFSNSPNLTRARLGKWLLEILLQEYVPNLGNAIFFLCGPFDYMRTATIVLQTEGVFPENIRKENFASVKPRVVAQPPDQEQHHVGIEILDQSYSIRVQYPETILQAAKRNGISLPYSCESGQCGSCSATCVSGKTWMWNNEVLTDSDIAKGRTLTCTAYPVGGDVTLKF